MRDGSESFVPEESVGRKMLDLISLLRKSGAAEMYQDGHIQLSPSFMHSMAAYNELSALIGEADNSGCIMPDNEALDSITAARQTENERITESLANSSLTRFDMAAANYINPDHDDRIAEIERKRLPQVIREGLELAGANVPEDAEEQRNLLAEILADPNKRNEFKQKLLRKNN